MDAPSDPTAAQPLAPASEATRELRRAVETKDLAGIDTALARGADIDAWSGKGAPLNALQQAALDGWEAGFDRLLDRGAGIRATGGGRLAATVLALLSTRSSHQLVARAFDAGGIDPDWRGIGGDTMLHLAASRTGLENVKRLLREGLDASIADKSGLLALHVAIGRHGETQPELIAALAAATPDLEARFAGHDGGCYTAVEQAFRHPAPGVLSHLLALGARPRVRTLPPEPRRGRHRPYDLHDRLARSPLENAVLTGSGAVVLLCLQRQPGMPFDQFRAGCDLARELRLEPLAALIQSWSARREADTVLCNLHAAP